MKYNEKMYNYLNNYFLNKIEKDEELGRECNSYFDSANALYDLKKITLEENDCLCDSLNGLIDFVIKLVSTCPDLFIIFTDEQKLKNLNKK